MPSPMTRAEPFIFIDKRTENGPLGQITEWAEGAEFQCLLILNKSTEAIIAERKDSISIYRGTVDKATAIERNQVIKRKIDGATFRVTSDPTDDESPERAGFQVKGFSAEKWDIPPE